MERRGQWEQAELLSIIESGAGQDETAVPGLDRRGPPVPTLLAGPIASNKQPKSVLDNVLCKNTK